MKQKVRITRVTLIIGLVLLTITSMFIGAYQFEHGIINTLKSLLFGGQISDADRFVLLQLRLPRIAMAMLIGSALAVSGTCLQGMFKNPLASPDLIGITSGAMLFAATTIVLGDHFIQFFPDALTYSFLSIMAFLGAMLTISLMYKMSSSHGKTNMVSLLLSSMAITALSCSVTSLLTYLSTDEQLRNLTF